MHVSKRVPEAPYLGGLLVMFAVVLVASVGVSPAAAQAVRDTIGARQTGSVSAEPTQPEKKKSKKKKANDAWRGRWDVAVGSTYDDNVFRLSPAQKQAVGTDERRYADMNAAYDVANTVRVRSGFRSPGPSAHRLDIGAEARLELYTMSRRQSFVDVRLSAEQRLSKRDAVSARVSFTPREFRRNYLIGTDGAGAAEYAAGNQRTLEGRVGYERTLLHGRGVPGLDASVHVIGERQTMPDFPWRDRNELGVQLGTDLRLGAVGLDLEAERSRAFHPGTAEPVQIDNTVMSMELDRDFDATTLAAATKLRLSKSARIGVSFEHRARDFHATLEEDPVYGDREDRRYTYGAELLLRAAPRVDVRLGGDYRRQLTFRPGRGDTGDEAKYSRRTAFLRLEYAR